MGQADPIPPSDDVPSAPPTLPASAAPGKCIHCGLDLGRAHDPADGPFCCRGCRTVYELINGAGLDRFYDLRCETIAPPADLRPDNLAWLEVMLADPDLDLGGGLMRLNLDLQGVHCAACVWLLEQLFARHPGGRDLTINPALGTAILLWDRTAGDPADYFAEIERFGYRFGPPRKSRRRATRSIQIRMGVTLAIAMNVMIYSLGYYFGLSPQESGPAYVLFGRLALVLTGVVVAVGGWPFLSAAWRGLRRGVVHLDLPIALGMLLGYGGSVAAYLQRGPEAAYFDTVAIFVGLMLIGRWLQEWVLEKNRNALLDSGGIADLYARRRREDRLEAVPAARIAAGDELWVAPGDLLPVAGVLLHEPADISLDWITGESAVSGREPGDRIPAGAFNAGDRGFRAAAVEDFADSRLHDLLRVGGGRRAGERDWWHRISTVYVITVLGLALVGMLTWWSAGPRKAVEVGVAVLVVTCPCALGLAVPLARELVHTALRRHGVLLRSDDFLDRVLQVRKILFDKTGTLTRGRLALDAASAQGLADLAADRRGVLRGMVERSNHPVSRCVAEALARDAAPPVETDDVREERGHGLVWTDTHGEWRFGRPGFALGGEGLQPEPGASYFSLDGQPLLGIHCVEELKRDAAEEVAHLVRDGYEVHLLSGDAPMRAARAGERLGLPPDRVHGGLTPEAKAAAVAVLDDADTLMVGDGLNDSLSFDRAWCAATPAVDRAVLPHKADFYYLGDGVSAVRRALQAARRLREVQKGNLVFAAVYNLSAVGLCLAGLVTPVVAAVLMPLSSVSVVGLTTLRLSRGRSRWMS